MALLLPALARANDGPEAVSAEWRSHSYVLTYSGFTSIYSCDGLEWKLKLLLKTAGARDDLSVRATCSGPTSGPSRFVTARLQFATLALPDSPPVPGEAPDAKRPAPVPAVGLWREVKFAQRSPRNLEGGDCELVEQFDRELLKYFTVRNRQEHMACIPHQSNLNGIALSFAVLAAPPKHKEPAKAK